MAMTKSLAQANCIMGKALIGLKQTIAKKKDFLIKAIHVDAKRLATGYCPYSVYFCVSPT
jgi:hypothetical protein